MTTTDTTIETRHDRRITVDHYDETTVLEIVNTSTDRVLGATLTPVEARRVAAALTGQGGQWTRDDLPHAQRLHDTFYAEPDDATDAMERIAVDLVDHLNAHHPKPRMITRSMLDKVAAERDAAIARAEAAEARTAPAVTRDDIEKAIRETEVLDRRRFAEFAARAVFDLVSGADPAVHVVRESDIAAIDVEKRENGGWYTGGGGFTAGSEHAAEHCRNQASHFLKRVAEHEAVARAIEAEAVVDPVEAKAQELYDVAAEGALLTAWGNLTDHTKGKYRRIARHVLGQEADQ